MNRAFSSLAVLAVLAPTSLAWAEDVPGSAADVGMEPAAPVAPVAPAISEPAPAPAAAPIASADPMEPAATSTAAGPAVVDQPSATNTSTEEHSGFYLGMQIPIGLLSVSEDGGDTVLDGTGPGFNLLIGGTPLPNLVLYGELSVVRAVNPDFESGGNSQTLDDAVMNLVQFGPGIVYYFMPSNIYVGGSVLLSRTTLEYDGEMFAESEMGIGVALRVGKEFWVGKDWGLGIGLESRVARMSDKGGDDTLNARSFGFTLGATYH